MIVNAFSTSILKLCLFHFRQTSPNVLFELIIPASEQLTGAPSNATLVRMEEIVSSWNEENAHTGMEPFLDVQSVPDKSVSDSVEALIGVYLNVNFFSLSILKLATKMVLQFSVFNSQTMGLIGAFKILTWFEILPRQLQVVEMLQRIPRSPRLGAGNPDDHMTQAHYIETQIGYEFEDRAYLLQVNFRFLRLSNFHDESWFVIVGHFGFRHSHTHLILPTILHLRTRDWNFSETPYSVTILKNYFSLPCF